MDYSDRNTYNNTNIYAISLSIAMGIRFSIVLSISDRIIEIKSELKILTGLS